MLYKLLYNLGFPHSSVRKESTCNAGDPGLIPELERSPGEGKGYPLEYSGLENSGLVAESERTERLSVSLSSSMGSPRRPAFPG